MLRSNIDDNAIDTVIADRSIKSMERIEIVTLVSWIAPEVQELEAFRYVVARDRVDMEPSMRKEAKYKRKRPNDNSKTRVCLKKDDTDLRVTICHIR
jgi:hypothetical protein